MQAAGRAALHGEAGPLPLLVARLCLTTDRSESAPDPCRTRLLQQPPKEEPLEKKTSEEFLFVRKSFAGIQRGISEHVEPHDPMEHPMTLHSPCDVLQPHVTPTGLRDLGGNGRTTERHHIHEVIGKFGGRPEHTLTFEGWSFPRQRIPEFLNPGFIIVRIVIT